MSSVCPDSGVSSSQAETDSCMSVLHFNVTSCMAPLSRLLVYYVRENGEGVTDSLQLPVQPRFENEVGWVVLIYLTSLIVFLKRQFIKKVFLLSLGLCVFVHK